MPDHTLRQPSATATVGSTTGDGPVRRDAEPEWLSPEQAKGLWRVEIALRIRDLWHRLLEARARVALAGAEDGGTDVVAAVPLGDGTAVSVHLHRSVETGAPANAPPWSSHFDAARDALEVADRSIGLPKGRDRVWETVKEWWTGTKVTAAWESVHSAEAELIAIGSDADVSSALPGLWSWMQQAMTEAERASYKDKMEGMLSGKEALDRNLIHQAYEDVIRANNDMHTGMRSFRNTLFIVSFGLTALLVLAGIWHAVNPHVLSFCTGTGTSAKCPGGGIASAAGIAFEIELVGALGGLLAAAFLVGEFKTAPSRYNLLSGQLMLKIAAGAAAAVLAILFLQSGLIVQPSKDVTAIEVVLGYAALFGFSQQLLTRLVDKRATALIEGQEEGKSEKGEKKK
jgi:hypothetical protein